jgi:hypothetical protein
LRFRAVKAKTTLAAPEWHSIQKPLEEVILDLFGIGDADVLGIAKRAPGHARRRSKIAAI